MKIMYKNKAVKKQFSSKYKSNWRYSTSVTQKLVAAENFFIQAESLQDIVSYPPFHFHSLKGDRKDEWSVYLGNTGYRVTLIPCDDDGYSITSGDIIAKCKAIKVIMITEVSKHYGE